MPLSLIRPGDVMFFIDDRREISVQIFGVEHPTTNIQQPTSNNQHPTTNIQQRGRKAPLGVGCSMFDVRCLCFSAPARLIFRLTARPAPPAWKRPSPTRRSVARDYPSPPSVRA